MSTAKIASNLQTQMRAAALDEPIGVIVRHKPSMFSVQSIVPNAQVVHTYRLVPATAMRVSSAGIQALSQDETVDFIWPDLPVHTWLDQSVPHIRVPQVWQASVRARG